MKETWISEDQEELNQAKRRIFRKAVLVSSLILIFTLLISGYMLYSMISKAASHLCENHVIEVKSQPNKEIDLVHFRRDCGATTGYSYQLSILTHGSNLPNKSGNLFISHLDFNVEWKDNRTIILSGNFGEVYKKKQGYKGIRIEYKDN